MIRLRQTCHETWRRRRRGTVLLVVAVLVMLLSLVAYKYMLTMQTEHMAAAINGDRVQALQAAYSVRDLLIVMLESSRKTRDEAGGLYDNPVYFGGDPTTLSMGLAGSSMASSSLSFSSATESGSASTSSSLSGVTPPPFGTIGYAIPLPTDAFGSSGGIGNQSYETSSSLSSVGGRTSTDSLASSTGASATTATTGANSTFGTSTLVGTGPPTRYGVKNESARLHLWTVLNLELANAGDGVAALMALPGMDEATADSILDWLDEDDEPRENGAESEFYSMLTRPLAPRNALPPDLDELLFVRGVNAWRLFGIQTNDPLLVAASMSTNGTATNGFGNASQTTSPFGSRSSSAAGSSSRIGNLRNSNSRNSNTNRSLGGEDRFGSSYGGGQLDAEPVLPWAEYLTVYSAERNESYAGKPRIFLNGKDLEALHSALSKQLSAEIANFLILYRQFGGNIASQSKPGQNEQDREQNGDDENSKQTTRKLPQLEANESASSVTISFENKAQYAIKNPLDLIGVTVTVPTEEDEDPIVVQNPFGEDASQLSDQFEEMLDKVSTYAVPRIIGRVNVNEASPTVLLALPGMTETIVEAIMSERREQQASEFEASSSSFGSIGSSTGRTFGAATGEGRFGEAEAPKRLHPIWLLTEGIVDVETMRKLWHYVTCSGDVFRAEVWGYVDDRSPSVRFETVLDASTKKCRSVYYRELSAPRNTIQIKAPQARIAASQGNQTEGGFGNGSRGQGTTREATSL